jgi:hypothetical protein
MYNCSVRVSLHLIKSQTVMAFGGHDPQLHTFLSKEPQVLTGLKPGGGVRAGMGFVEEKCDSSRLGTETCYSLII